MNSYNKKIIAGLTIAGLGIVIAHIGGRILGEGIAEKILKEEPAGDDTLEGEVVNKTTAATPDKPGLWGGIDEAATKDGWDSV